MRNSRKIHAAAVAVVLAFTNAAFGQESNPVSVSVSTHTRTIADGQKLKIEGIVLRSGVDTFTLRASDGTETEVVLTQKTSIKSVRRVALDKTAGPNDILRGLRLKAEGRGNSDGQLVARKIRFDEEDLRVARALASRVDPVESQANSTEVLAQSNEERIGTAEQRIDAAEQNAQRTTGQVEELSVVAYDAEESARNAQTSADRAGSNASLANQRIKALDDYQVYKAVTVHFRSGSARLSTAAKAEIDEVVSNVSHDLRGWIVLVEGYADSRGQSAKNRSLSERRANAVIDYLVTKHDVHIRRVVQPFGYGSSDPVATNNSRVGRSLNRRAEITILVNQGISSQADSLQTISEDLLPRP